MSAGVGAGALVLTANASGTDLYHQTLAAKDGWAPSGTGTTGVRIAYVVVTLIAALSAGFSGAVLLLRAEWIVKALTDYQVPRAWWPGCSCR